MDIAEPLRRIIVDIRYLDYVKAKQLGIALTPLIRNFIKAALSDESTKDADLEAIEAEIKAKKQELNSAQERKVKTIERKRKAVVDEQSKYREQQEKGEEWVKEQTQIAQAARDISARR